MSTSDSLLGIPFPDFQGGFTPWDCQEPLFVFQQEELSKPHELVISNSGSQNPKPVTSDSGSDDPNQTASIVDERKTRRKISNRLSARRSRMRKQKHLENLRNQVNRLRMGNRDLMSRLNLVMQHCQLVWEGFVGDVKLLQIVDIWHWLFQFGSSLLSSGGSGSASFDSSGGLALPTSSGGAGSASSGGAGSASSRGLALPVSFGCAGSASSDNSRGLASLALIALEVWLCLLALEALCLLALEVLALLALDALAPLALEAWLR
ncbi:hypothetical protein F0562_013062 [Nyssa sinensis]|uniref:BZIP domain-containing protein n=1 Tax=Nyssa sinensis TaxID=561372 RepID=A0A5J4ZZP6_9ASTE|nr:hypothetical protein F0562_013062 [Nyssa sinensis]